MTTLFFTHEKYRLWDPFLGWRFKVDANVFRNFEGFPVKRMHCLDWLYNDP